MRPAPSRRSMRPTYRAPRIAGYVDVVSRIDPCDPNDPFTSQSPLLRLLAVARKGTVPDIPADGVFLEWYSASRMVTAMGRPYRDAILRNRLPFLIDDRPHGTGRAIYIVPKES